MANNQNRITFGLAFMQVLISILGTNRTGKTGAQKREQVINSVEPLINFGATIAENNTSDALSKEEIALSVQGVHDALLTSGLIHDTAALEDGTANVAAQTPPAINVHLAPAPAPEVAPASPEPPADGAKYRQWLRLATQGVMPSNQTLAANRYQTGDQLFNDGDASNAAEFYFVVESTLQGFAPPHSPTNRIARPAGLVG